MEKYVVMGGRPLSGKVRIGGSKNSVLALLPACLLTEEECILYDVPDLSDVHHMLQVLEILGAATDKKQRTISIDAARLQFQTVPDRLARSIRASNLILGPLLARLGQAWIPFPGGCSIGSRPMDQHLRGLRLMGAEITEKFGCIEARAKKLKGCEICLDFPSVGATENLMMAATLAQGVTVIQNAAREPEIVELQNFLNAMGARVRGGGSNSLRIEGVNRLRGAEHVLIPDRIETGTYMVMALATKGQIFLENVISEHLDSVIAKLREAGAVIREEEGGLWIGSPAKLKPVDCKTMPYPGFPTDMQAQLMALMTTVPGASIATETIFENRFQHVAELCRMGADIRVDGRTAVVQGVAALSGAYVEATDLRAGAALVTAAMMAEGASVIGNIHYIDRGYEHFEQKLTNLGAQIMRITG
ncbi:MAG: UDP-N-acetylglucosamine 1-carboxyvinyltransferase [Peptococcaceae bacterium]|nr:UDP-N-acetylglucosamine 1-carboxyvinyltransferase [Peptococcaceae bacterium]